MVEFLQRRVVLRKKLLSTNNWESEDNGILLTNSFEPRASINLSNKRDSFSFRAFSPNSELYETFFSGDGVTTVFTLKFSPIPSEHVSGSFKKFDVFISDVLQTPTTNYSLSGDQITFVSAPASGNRNIRIAYPVIESDDLMDIYLWSNQSFASLTQAEKDTARRIEGTITEPNLDRSKNIVSCRGYGIIDSIFAGMAFSLDASAENRSHLVIQSIIAQLNQFNPNRRIYGQDATEWVDIGNATTTNDITYTSKYKTSIEMIEEVSGDQYTGNGQYIYFVQYNPRSSTTTSTTSNKLVDSTASFVSTLAGLTVYNNTDGTSTTISAVDSATQLSLSSDIFTSGEDYIIPTYDLHWKAKPLSVTGSLTEGVEPSEIKVGKSVDGVINVVIYNAGLDPHGNGMEFLNYDFTISGTGSRWKYVSQTSTIGADIVKAEFEADTSLWDTTSDGNRIGNFPSSGSYSYTMQFEDRDSSGVKTGVLAVAANDNDFNDLVRNESKWQGRGRTDQIIRRFSNPRFKCTKFIPYSEASEYVLGDIYTLTIPSFGLSAKKLRLMQLDYEFWGVQLQFEEDETTILEAEL